MSAPPTNPLSASYIEALRVHLDEEGRAGVEMAPELGMRAVSLGLETLDLARMHHEALEILLGPECAGEMRERMTAHAAGFFNEANVPVENTHLLAIETAADIQRLKETLTQRTADLADSNHELKQGVLQRKTAEAALEAGERASAELLRESLLMEKNLKGIAHEILAANEVERKKMSLLLHDEISQTLLGIYVRLLALKREVAVKDVGFAQEIATTQRLVEESVKTINRLVREFDENP